LGSPAAWLSETFNADAGEDDLISSRSLNITRIGAVVVPVLAAIWTAISEWADKPPFNDVEFQKTLIVALIPFIAVLAVADMFSRAIATKAVATSMGIVAFATPISATKSSPGPDSKGKVVAYRGGESTGAGQYLFVSEDGRLSWESAVIIVVGG
jgi:hypothetical protein